MRTYRGVGVIIPTNGARCVRHKVIGGVGDTREDCSDRVDVWSVHVVINGHDGGNPRGATRRHCCSDCGGSHRLVASTDWEDAAGCFVCTFMVDKRLTALQTPMVFQQEVFLFVGEPGRIVRLWTGSGGIGSIGGNCSRGVSPAGGTQSTQVCGVGSPGRIYGGFELESCSTTAMTAELNLERTEGMMRVRRAGETVSVDDELVDEKELFGCLVMGSDSSATGSSCSE